MVMSHCFRYRLHGNQWWYQMNKPTHLLTFAFLFLQGHFTTELWGLCPHPTEAEYVTVGDDRTLRVWSIHDHRVKKMHKLENPSRAVAYSPEGDMIAVGYGSPLEVAQPGKRLFDGGWILSLLPNLINPSTLTAWGVGLCCVLMQANGRFSTTGISMSSMRHVTPPSTSQRSNGPPMAAC